MELRGFDQYEVTLGDEIRGDRASLGKSVEDVERDLRIRRDLLMAIETCDLTGVSNPGLLPGYVRSYARYLGQDPDDFYRRFCAESGFVPPRAVLTGDAGQGRRGHGKRLQGSPFDQSRFAVTPDQARFSARISLGALVSTLCLALLTAGLGYGGYAVLQNIQRVGIAPLPEAPDVIAVVPEISAPGFGTAEAATRPDADAYTGSGALAAVYAAEPQPAPVHRDGPISAIDPNDYGVYAGRGPDLAPRAPDEGPLITTADEAIRAFEARAAILRRLNGAQEPELAEAPAPAGPKGVAIQVTDTAWIRVRNGDRAVIREGLLEPGERYVLPERVLRGTLRAGNAGAVYLLVDGAVFGPVGRPGGVVKNVSLAPEDIRTEQAAADPQTVLVTGPEDAGLERAEAD